MSMLFSRQHTLMLFVPFSLENEDYYATWTGGLGGIRLGLLKLLPDTRPAEVRTEVQHRQDRLNSSTAEYAFEMNELYTHTEYTFFRGKDISAPLVYSMLLMVLLIVPAINISGMTNARMQERVTEIAVRKAYGASRISIMVRLFFRESAYGLFGWNFRISVFVCFGLAGTCMVVW